MSDLTSEDIAWLESRIGAAIQPVTPREDFVRAARERLMSAALDPSQLRDEDSSIVLPIAGILFMLAVSIFWRWRMNRSAEG